MSVDMSQPGTLTVEPFGVRLAVQPDEKLLQAILRNGNYVPFGCNHGGCGTCAAQLVAGDLEQDSGTLTTLDERARAHGQVLLCSSRLVSDSAVVDVTASGISGEEFAGAPLHDREVTVDDVTAVSPGLSVLTLSAPPPPWTPRPGQFVHIELPDRTGWRAYSLASPAEASLLQFVIRAVPGGAFTTALDEIRPGGTLRIRGPYGAFQLRTSHRPKLFIGSGAGIGPIRSMIHDLLRSPGHPPAHLVHVARSAAELVFGEEFAALAKADNDFAYHPLLPQHPRRGTDRVLEWLAAHATAVELRRTEAYLCGPDRFVDITAGALCAAGLRSRYLAADRFTASAGPAVTPPA
ncbi:2Fe-2S iron-sulfur cluster-binding protein [Mycolicibacter hiberniae]|uniref:Phenol hydroxylase P5 protein n=1 Tax=Mycolicibacter hiberniae TaxID=29314 RepID=A0A7I7XAD6_9MYCO|nr:2Fe-2S iron-sulfur cluster-binding protein [Mycolicibacter hiberniae]MCV7087215.1 2Fe-2S iron-sulfur cluster binding domain-containing protein [Mycolicibacter hiberniae]ORV67794.1 hypothetical protein AWC09_16675 [Mycolicibacter hiberniae]BBZ25571.1 phenol hydroxylase P5 protein [Mycolicibacter hiberniae]